MFVQDQIRTQVLAAVNPAQKPEQIPDRTAVAVVADYLKQAGLFTTLATLLSEAGAQEEVPTRQEINSQIGISEEDVEKSTLASLIDGVKQTVCAVLLATLMKY